MGLSLVRHQSIIWINNVLLLIWPLGQISKKLESKCDNLFTWKLISEMSSGNWRLFSLSCTVNDGGRNISYCMFRNGLPLLRPVHLLKKYLICSGHYHIYDKCHGPSPMATMCLDTSKPETNGRKFGDVIFEYIMLKENVYVWFILIWIMFNKSLLIMWGSLAVKRRLLWLCLKNPKSFGMPQRVESIKGKMPRMCMFVISHGLPGC